MVDTSSDSIALVGMSCRFPGGANDPESLWSMLCDGKDTWTEVPTSRFNAEASYHPSSDNPGTTNHRGGHFLDGDVSAFDADFFGISPAEATAMDPQQRLMLETAYEALENADIPLEAVKGSNTGVYAATFSRDYDRMLYRDLRNAPKYHMTGTGDAILSNRLSYLFDLKGPSITIDTGCSGSMVALHAACQSLRAGESNMAIVGGVNLILAPDAMTSMSNLGILNSDGKCYAFDDRGAGYGRGEGAATVILKRSKDARASGDRIRCIIRATGVNQDGKTNGITQPNPDSQRTLMRNLYAQAGVYVADVGYVEAHGTGTVVGDAAETDSISKVFCSDRSAAHPLIVGSIKPNIGHTEAASGIAGLIKSVLALEHGMIPPTININELKGSLNLGKGTLQIARTLQPWPSNSNQTCRTASVNSYGYGGTNAHCILQSEGTGLNGDSNPSPTQKQSCQERLVVVSAHSEHSLASTRSSLAEWTAVHQDEHDVAELAHVLCSRRSHLQWRSAFVAASLLDLSKGLSETKSSQGTKAAPSVETTFVFTGQGAQWYGMGRELIQSQEGFKASLCRSDEILRSLGSSWSLMAELGRDAETSKVSTGQIAQPATTAIQIALVDLLSIFKIRPSTVLGHSSGEIAAAYAAGALTQESAMSVSYYRGVAAEQCKSLGGTMMAVGTGRDDVVKYLKTVKGTTQGEVCVACVNSPSSVTLSGDKEAMAVVQKLLEQDGVFHRSLAVDVAYHSHHMRAAADAYQSALAGFHFGRAKPDVEFVSTVTASKKDTDFDAEYWVSNLVSTVQFSDALKKVQEVVSRRHAAKSHQWTHTLLEVGPHSALEGPIKQILKTLEIQSGTTMYISVLSRKKSATICLLSAVGTLFAAGTRIDFDAVNGHVTNSQRATSTLDLPTYSWDHRKSFWHESRLNTQIRKHKHAQHELLGTRVLETSEPTWRQILRVDTMPWLQDHVVDGVKLFPAAGFLCMAIEAMRQLKDDWHVPSSIEKIQFSNVSFTKAVIIPEMPSSIELQICVRSTRMSVPQDISSQHHFAFWSYSDESWTNNCSGMIDVVLKGPSDSQWSSRQTESTQTLLNEHIQRVKEACSEAVDRSAFYDQLREHGNSYSHDFALLDDIRLGNITAHAMLSMPQVVSGLLSSHLIHPTTLDSLLQPVLPLLVRSGPGSSVVPVAIDRMEIAADTPYHGSKDELQITAEILSEGRLYANANIAALRLGGASEVKPAITIQGLDLRRLGATIDSEKQRRCLAYRMEHDVDVSHISPEYLMSACASDSSTSFNPAKAQLLDRGASIFAQRCLQDLAQKEQTVLETYEHFLAWLQKFSTSLESHNSSDDESVTVQIRHAGVEGEALHRVGFSLARIMTGEVDPLSLMTEDELLHRVYSDDSTMQCSKHLANYVKALRFKGSGLKVLEIGAGTGGTTALVLEALEDQMPQSVSRYDFTDISSGFFLKARSKFEQWASLLHFEKLDIEQDPETQGYECGSYDLVIAANVLHATSCIDVTLKNVRKLLKPTGKLAMIEVTRLSPALNVTFGIFPDWWKGVHEGRIDAPTLSTEEWNGSLSRNGFEGAKTAVNDYGEHLDKTTLIVSGLAQAKDELLCRPPIALLRNCDSSLACKRLPKNLSLALQTGGYQVCITDWHSMSYDPETLYIILDCTHSPLLSVPTFSQFGDLTALMAKATRVFWLTERPRSKDIICPEAGLFSGFTRVARVENQNLRLVTLDFELETDHEVHHLGNMISKVCDASFTTNCPDRVCEFEYTYRGHNLQIPRLIPDSKLNRIGSVENPHADLTKSSFHNSTPPLKLDVETPGMLNSLVFVSDDAACEPLKSDEILVEVRACGINFKDVFVALGQMQESMKMTGECSGIVSAVGSSCDHQFKIADRVCCWNGTPYASQSRVKTCSAQLIPSTMSFIEAASFPVAFATAYYGLLEVARLQAGQTLLVHAASGGVGQAAIMIAQDIGARVIAMVGSEDKATFLKSEYNIREEFILSNRKKGFKDSILRLTDKVGVDVVLNSTSGYTLQESFECLAPMGTFVELGKTDIAQKTGLSMQPFERNVSFASVDLVLLAKHRPLRMQHILSRVLAMVEEGRLRAIRPITTMPISDISNAFRLIQARKHIGKVVLEAGADSMVTARLPLTPSYRLSNDASYIVIGGTGRIGRQICQLLDEKEAGCIVVLTRKSTDEDQEVEFVRELALSTSRVVLLTCDVGDAEQVRDMAKRCRESLPTVKGVINAAMELQDRTISTLESSDFAVATAPKVKGNMHLKKEFDMAGLDFVVLLSSVAAVLGTRGQANYAAGNTFQDDLAGHLTHNGTAYVSLGLSVLKAPDEESKMLQAREDFIVREGGVPISMSETMAMVSYAISTEARSSGSRHIVYGIDRRSVTSSGLSRIDSPLFTHLPREEHHGMTGGTKAEGTRSTKEALEACDTAESAKEVLVEEVANQISSLTTLDRADVSLEDPLSSFGLDSLLAVEMKNWTNHQLRAKIQTTEILDASSITDLAGTMAARSEIIQHPDKQPDKSINTNGDVALSQPEEDESANSPPTLPKQPLPTLDHSLELYVEAIRPCCSDRELEITRAKAQDCLKQDSSARRLQQRLQDRVDDPTIENWQIELYVSHYWLRNRLPVHPYQTLYASMQDSPTSLSQATKAAIIAYEALLFKTKVQAKGVATDFLLDKPLCMDSLALLFNTGRLPAIGKDEAFVHAKYNHVVVLRRGHFFKIPLLRDGSGLSFERMLATMLQILAIELPEWSSASALAADHRDSWAKTRSSLGDAAQENQDLLDAIDTSAFIVCLDEQSPTNPSERYNQYLLGDPRNRWCDKSLQFVVCPNGASAYVATHSTFDGVTMQKMLESMNRAIKEYTATQHESEPQAQAYPVETLAFSLTPTLLDHSRAIISDFQTRTPRYIYLHHTHTNFGSRFFHAHKASPNSGFQLLIQLASRLYFGCQVPSWETVSLRTFRQGRVDLMQTALPAVADFCDAIVREKSGDDASSGANGTVSSKTLVNGTSHRTPNKIPFLEQFHTATAAVSRILTLNTRGLGFARHLMCLQEVASPSESLPALFTDPSYANVQPAKLRTDCAKLGHLVQEAGIVMPDPEGVWVHYEVEEEGCAFVVVGAEGRAEGFVDALGEAGRLIEGLFVV